MYAQKDYAKGTQWEHMKPNTRQEILDYGAKALKMASSGVLKLIADATGLPLNAAGDWIDNNIDKLYDWFKWHARSDIGIPVTTLRRAGSYWGSQPIDWKHDPLYSVGHNQDKYLMLKDLRKPEVREQHPRIGDPLSHDIRTVIGVPLTPLVPTGPVPAQVAREFSKYQSRVTNPAEIPVLRRSNAEQLLLERRARSQKRITPSPAWTRVGF